MGDETNKDSKFTKQFAANRKGNAASFSEKYKNPNALPNKSAKFSSILQDKPEKEVPFSDSKNLLRKSKLNNKNFAESTKKSRLDCLFLVRGKDNGRAAWHYVLVDKPKREMFLAKSRSGSIDVALYGQILYSGWGENPPEDIVKKIEDEFGA
ncbi:hypothetical protein ECHLIB_0544 [Ehrlichia chaffeensis str. Liberty]|uniref:Uncharacterized protein n=1 Tax=Ehrlichia chaffeensis (strain ATCC CRL-10679 / Arkansas) TaxID=205920 RepID=Q2GGN5_EHRCR|nr:hypothetical protein [Ehrlichia chaffeensis]ABD45073.1 conserved hypothetical protein [Ehrlichia chaffeensis str. Arkansas]AHX05606.1 hypothetical protein ECHJAX_0542 [Ehrlichia chaffeensis str. Jax]AHX06597.1 hypothetical protein ECHLIB_0544 [Ehrlichia chaffeensis str. Liberty]AHX07513.1 hypothetical protein ECHOSC_0522 [Ehrlichia chaffeensis str. Osceola]AHX08617.1 hypothetical protein ECHSTV_0532 [Ehrlichia chaffeensis str. Saint Vincent]